MATYGNKKLYYKDIEEIVRLESKFTDLKKGPISVDKLKMKWDNVKNRN